MSNESAGEERGGKKKQPTSSDDETDCKTVSLNTAMVKSKNIEISLNEMVFLGQNSL
jgi:hypothetical protein